MNMELCAFTIMSILIDWNVGTARNVAQTIGFFFLLLSSSTDVAPGVTVQHMEYAEILIKFIHLWLQQVDAAASRAGLQLLHIWQMPIYDTHA